MTHRGCWGSLSCFVLGSEFSRFRLSDQKAAKASSMLHNSSSDRETVLYVAFLPLPLKTAVGIERVVPGPLPIHICFCSPVSWESTLGKEPCPHSTPS